MTPIPDGEGAADWRAAVRALEGAYAPTTLSAWTEQFQAFEAWCEATGEPSLPARPQGVAAHVMAIFPAYSTRSVLQRLKAIRRIHELVQAPDPTLAAEVRLALRRGQRAHGRPPRQAAPMNHAMRDRLVGACGEDLRGLRDRVIVSLGYDLLCRCSELVALQLEDLVRLPDGTGQVIVRRGKADTERAGKAGYLSRRAMGHLDAWLEASGIRSGAIVRGVNQKTLGKRPLCRTAVNLRLRALAKRAGYDAATARSITTHSMRVGAAQDLAIAGKTYLQIMHAGRWQDVRGVDRYVRHAPINVWADT